MTPMEHQQFQRLRVNRIAVIQELKVDHILHYLLANSVLNDGDLGEINTCRTTTEKSKRLLDILPTKGRASNWYKHFRAALLNPSVEDSVVKHKYEILVEFLDNTIIDQLSHPVRAKRKTSQQMASFNRYQPLPEISNNSSRPPTVAVKATKPTMDSKAVGEAYYSKKAAAADRTSPAPPVADSNALADDVDDAAQSSKWSMRQLQGNLAFAA